MNLKKVFCRTAGVFALIWLGCYFLFGSVPFLEKLALDEGVFWILPFGLSRFWDVLFAPIMLVFSLWAVKRYSKLGSGNQPEFDVGLVNGFVLSVSVLVSCLFFHERVLFCFFLGYAIIGFLFAGFFSFLDNSFAGFVLSLGLLAFGGYGFGLICGFAAATLLVGIIFCSCLAGVAFSVAMKLFLRWLLRAFNRRELFLREW